MFFSPGTRITKFGEASLSLYIENFIKATNMYFTALKIPFILFLIILIISIYRKNKNIVQAVAFFLTGMILNYVHIVAAYYPARNMFPTCIYTIIAIIVLLDFDIQHLFGKICITLGMCEAILTANQVAIGGSGCLYDLLSV